VVNSHALYLGGPGFKSQPWRPATLIEVFRAMSVPPGEFRDSTLKLGHYRFLPNPFQVVILLVILPSTLYSLVTEKASLNKHQSINETNYIYVAAFARFVILICNEAST
jgi:hypothetical protein